MGQLLGFVTESDLAVAVALVTSGLLQCAVCAVAPEDHSEVLVMTFSYEPSVACDLKDCLLHMNIPVP